MNGKQPSVSGILITSEWICEMRSSCHARSAAVLYVTLYLLHGCIAANQLLPQVGDVVVKPLHVLLEILPEVQERLLHLTLELLQTKSEIHVNSWQQIPARRAC